MGDEDLERADDLGQGDAFVRLPVLYGLDIVDEDDKVLRVALVVDLGLLSFTAGHDCCCLGGCGVGKFEVCGCLNYGLEIKIVGSVLVALLWFALVWKGRRSWSWREECGFVARA